MEWNEWQSLKNGDKIKHINGDVETIREWGDDKYIEGEKCLFPLSEFNHKEWEKVGSEVS